MKWTMQNRQQISIRDMADSHLRNTIKMLEHEARKRDMQYITEEEAQEAGISVQEQALKRTEVKRRLCKAGIAYDNNQRFEELESMLEEHEDEKAGKTKHKYKEGDVKYETEIEYLKRCRVVLEDRLQTLGTQLAEARAENNRQNERIDDLVTQVYQDARKRQWMERQLAVSKRKHETATAYNIMLNEQLEEANEQIQEMQSRSDYDNGYHYGSLAGQAKIKKLEGALESIANIKVDEEMDRLHSEGTSWGRIYEDRAWEALKGAK